MGGKSPCLLLGALLALGLGGCGGRTYPVEGTVVWSDGTPAKELAGGAVTFESADGKVSARGEIREDATFTMGTFKGADGAVPGQHKVVVTPPLSPDIDKPLPVLLDPRFQRLDSSGLEVVVEPKDNQITITVEKVKPKRGP